MEKACKELVTQIGEIRPPIKLAPLARLLGAQLNYDDQRSFGQEEASIQFRDGELVLWVSKARFEDPRTRKRARFSIGHELGHLLMFRMLGPEFLDHSERDLAAYALTERLCDFAASQILMPRSVLHAAVQERQFTAAGLRFLEELFGVSSTALLKAVADLVPQGAALELRKFRRGPREQLTWRVWSVATATSSLDLTSWLPTGCTLKHLVGLPSPESLPEDVAVRISTINLVRSRTRNRRDAIVTRTLSGRALQRDFLPASGSARKLESVVQDQEAGRVLLFVAEPGSMENLWKV